MKKSILIQTLLVVLLSFPFPDLKGQESTEKPDSLALRGEVTDLYDRPVRGVSVSLMTSGSAPVFTDSTGSFKLTVPVGTNRIFFSSLDHHNKEILLADRAYVKVFLTPKNVRSGYTPVFVGDYRVKARNLTSPVDFFLLTDDKYTQPEITVSGYMQGRVPGVLSVAQSGMPGSGNFMLVRGMSSLFTNNHPLVVIDNIPIEYPGTLLSRVSGNDINSLTSINPLDISSITILKDAGAAARYGLQGSNGVIIINTLDPTATQTTIDFMFRSGLRARPSYLPQLEDGGYKALANEILASSALFEEEYQQSYPGLYLQPGDLGYADYQHNKLWQDEIFTSSYMTEANLVVKGGDEISRYGLSVGYINDGGTIRNTGFTSYNIRFTSYLKVYKWLEMNVNANLNNNSSSLAPSAIQPESNPILASLFKSPILSPVNYDDNGNVLQSTADIHEFGISNPRAVVQSSTSDHVNNRFITSMKLRANISQNLTWNSLFGLNLNSLREEIFRPELGMADYLDGLAFSYSEANTDKFNSVYTGHYLSYSRTIGEVHELVASSGFRLRTDRLEHDWGRAVNLPTNDEFSELQSGDNSLNKLGGLSDAYNTLAGYAGGNYMYRDRYAVSAAFSLDFSSRNGNDNQELLHIGSMPFSPSFSLGAGWRLSSEPFLSGISWLENAFLRATYGRTGNDDIGNVNALDYYMQVRYRETSGLIPGTIPNTLLKNEESRQVNLGLDLSILADRYRVSVDLFDKETSELLFYLPQEAYIGYLSRPENGGSIVNRGVEASLYARLAGSVNWLWDVSGNITFLDDHVKMMETPILTPFEGGTFITREGDPVAAFYGYEYMGVFTTTEEAGGLLNDRGMPYGGGDAIYADLSGPMGEPDGIIDEYDKTILGSVVPDVFGQLASRISYGNLSMDLSVYFVVGNEIFNYVRYRNESMTGLENQSIKTLERWQKEGDETEIPRALWNDPIGNTDFSSRWIEDGSYLRLKDVTVSYRIPREFLLFRDALFFVTASNMVTLTSYLGYDPEFSFSFNPLEQGIDYGMMPVARKIMIGFKLGL